LYDALVHVSISKFLKIDMRKEPVLPTEDLLISFFGSVICIVLLLVIFKLVEIWKRRKSPNLKRLKQPNGRREKRPDKRRQKNKR